jgi:hypothetical protein
MTEHPCLAREITAFEAYRAELVSKAVGKYALVYRDEVAAIHNTERLAITDGRMRGRDRSPGLTAGTLRSASGSISSLLGLC